MIRFSFALAGLAAVAACSESSIAPEGEPEVVVFVDSPGSLEDGIQAGVVTNLHVALANTGSAAAEDLSIGLCFSGAGPLCQPSTWTEVGTLPADTTQRFLLSATADPVSVGIEALDLVLVACVRDASGDTLACSDPVGVPVRPNLALLCGERAYVPIGEPVPLDDPSVLCVVGLDAFHVAQVWFEYGSGYGMRQLDADGNPAGSSSMVYEWDGRAQQTTSMPGSQGTGFAPPYTGNYFIVEWAVFDNAESLFVFPL